MTERALEIRRVSALATVQDGGRPGLMHAGVPTGGAMSPELLARANAAARNGPNEAAIEAFGDLDLFARGPLVLATCAGTSRSLASGERAILRRPPDQRMHYVAVRGGLDVPRVLGGRGTLLVANLGGHEGRPLRAGDVVPLGDAATVPPLPLLTTRDGPIALAIGPDADAFEPDARAALGAGIFTIAPASDRTGTRLGGPVLAVRDRSTRPSTPMIRGALQVPPDGHPIVLGPDHPTTGGYPIVACIKTRDFGRFMQIPLGRSVRFVIV